MLWFFVLLFTPSVGGQGWDPQAQVVDEDLV